MKKSIRSLTAIILIVAVLSASAVFSYADSSEKIGLLTDSYANYDGEDFTLSADSRIFIVSDAEPAGDLLQAAKLIAKQTGTLSVFGGTAPETVWGPENRAKSGDILLQPDSSVASEGYKIEIDSTAKISASGFRGLVYGANTIMKALGNSNTLQSFTAEDTPDTKQRVVMLDTGRKYFTAEWIKNFIRQISWMGYNALEFHFSEDGGFRADFWDKNFYKDANGDGVAYSPENDFSWLCGSKVQSWVKAPYRNDPDADKYLTTAEIIDIINVAKEYHIDIIPSFDSPSHMDYITWKFEQNYIKNPSYNFTYGSTTYFAKNADGCINYTGRTGDTTPTWPYYSTVDITKGTVARAFVFALYEDIADFFREYAGSVDFSIGADEVNLSKSEVIWSYSDFPEFINSLNRMLNAKGYTCRIFNDFIGSATYNKSSAGKALYSFDKNIEIMYWTSNFSPTTGKYNKSIWPAIFFWETENGTTNDYGDGNRIMYNCISSNCYYVLRVAASNTSFPNMDARNPENRNWSFYASNEKDIYNKWHPASMISKGVYSGEAPDVPEKSLGGAYFLIWNDYASLNTEAEIWNDVKDNTGTSDIVYSLFDRMWSNSIKMWNSDINKTVTYETFAKIRDGFGYFPGFTSCSQAAALPAGKEINQAYLADHTILKNLINNAVSNENGIYTDESFTLYKKALSDAIIVDSNYDATAQQLLDAAESLRNAENSLILQTVADAEIISISKISDITPLGKKAGLIIVTAPTAETLTVSLDGEEIQPTEQKNALQTKDGNQVRVWYINFKPAEKGAYNCTITTNGTVSETIEVIVK